MTQLANLVNDLLGFSNVEWLKDFEDDFFRNNAFGTFSKNLNKNLDELFSDLRSDAVRTSYKTYYDKETGTYKAEYTATSVLTEESRTKVMRRYITVWNAFAVANRPDKIKLTFVFTNRDGSVKRYVFFYTKEKKVFECASDSSAAALKNIKLDCVKFIYQCADNSCKASAKPLETADRPTAKFTTYADALKQTLKERRSTENVDFLCQEVKNALDNSKFHELDNCVKLCVKELSNDSVGFRSKFAYVNHDEFAKALVKLFGFSKADVKDESITLYF